MSFFDNFSEEREEENLTVRELLTEMKDISEVIVDLAYASLLFDSNEIGDEVKHLESKMDVLNYEIRSRTMLASRTKDDAIQLSGLLQIAESAAAISKAAGDIVGIREINPQNGPFLSFVLRDAEEKILPLTINKKSDMRGKSIDDLSIEAETGMRIIAIKRDIRWIYDPEGDVRLKENDMLIVRGTEDGFRRLRKFAHGEEKWPTYPVE
ncbi:potassium channel family protein [Candidatus Methanomassiliicoccus intestinalis]|uniref:potassium channel family protein n=1 Tax=Candidatus Methanomassiliicoccus intestinalis TaxID=1406512 RepID=UPI0037DC03A9